MAQPTVFNSRFNEPANNLSNTSSLLERRQQTATFLQPLGLPSLPPLSQLLTTEVKQEQENVSSAIETTAAAMANSITSTAQPLVQHQTTGTFLPTTTAVYDTHILPTETILYDNNATLDPSMIDPPMFNLISSSLTDPQQLMIRQRQESVSSSSSDKVYSFVAIPGTNQKKRPRRRYDEIERLYHCNFPGCTKSYGTLNHLNAHVSMQQHGPKRQPSEFKEMRKEWRRQKKERESAKKAAEVVMQQQQQQQQQQFQNNMLQYPFHPTTMTATLGNFY
ncbi:hypothetical protein G6F47_012993 [Rhizopus delemar]|uniref:C2H2-type domain-containing protein n=3 Tax=Rhizopus TaxID=4842 RepID=I1BKB7_RHIO9|nr:hypothetical protein RO3G_01351 [Rhizopus delemar RA 99-880]KAG1516471.1 hypothetical protein G6F53_002139 [Rhizopus delemar]KAG1542225.1 hypothetical protein G6F51_007405 [Rhizopus arrhizus]KAG1552258.1 hypothetical protein G6F50_013120 [Rhizopus delemar]KAG1577802.1 hypothetical protein G6F47_012993 [Rhizopus delemar]|eukprot:EIE76647.1 hypothetical protein RO3G_01351 [Rhizopus delemar RA 99-880]